MSRCEKANAYYESGYNCCQSVLAAFSDLTHLNEAQCRQLGSGFGHGTGTGELCGAVSGAIMTLGMLESGEADVFLESRKRTMACSKALQKQFLEKFGAIRCHELLKNPSAPSETTPAAQAMGLTKHCAIMVVTAVELVENMMAEKRGEGDNA
jgi:C_GCAxxG_C_C family probable redox protein